MKLFFIVIISLFTALISNDNDSKYVIAGWPSGGLAISLTSLLNHLAYCEQSNKIPVVYWGKELYYYNEGGFNGSHNVFEYYFEPVSNLKYNDNDTINYFCQSCPISFSYYDTSDEKRFAANQLFNKYVKIKPVVQKKIDKFYNRYMARKKTIGIHIRGTDKKIEEKIVEPKEMIKEAIKHADKNTQFLISTDEQKILDEMIKLLKGRKVIYYKCNRSLDGEPLHIPTKKNLFIAQNGEDVLVEMTLLSKCDVFLHTLSNVSSIPLYLNCNLINITLK